MITLSLAEADKFMYPKHILGSIGDPGTSSPRHGNDCFYMRGALLALCANIIHLKLRNGSLLRYQLSRRTNDV
jgi:hypothetical protein